MVRTKFGILIALVLLLALPIGTAFAQEAGNGEDEGTLGEGSAVIWDALALSDAITYTLTGVTPPPADMEYVGWLVSSDGATMLNTGGMIVNDGAINHTWDHNSPGYETMAPRNLIRDFSRVVITLEPFATMPTEPSGEPVFGDQIPSGVMQQIRVLLTDASADSGKGRATLLREQITLARTHAQFAQNATAMNVLQTHAHHVVNIIEGSSGPNFDSSFGNPGDGMGIGVHAQSVRDAANAAAAAAAGDEDIATNAENIVISTQNAQNLTTLARDRTVGLVLPQTNMANAKLHLSNVIGILDNALLGVDANADGVIEPIEGEGAANLAYIETQRMATYTFAGDAEIPLPGTGDPAIPMIAQFALAAAALLVIAGGFLVATGRRSRVLI